MSRRMVGILVLLLGSVGLGLLSGHWYFGIFEKTVPAAVVTDFNRATAYGFFLWRGVQMGLALFLWTLLAVSLAPLFRQPADRPGSERTRI